MSCADHPESQLICPSFSSFFRVPADFLVIQGKQNLAVTCLIANGLYSTEIQCYVMQGRRIKGLEPHYEHLVHRRMAERVPVVVLLQY